MVINLDEVSDQLVKKFVKTLNEHREEAGLPKLDGERGEIILIPNFIKMIQKDEMSGFLDVEETLEKANSLADELTNRYCKTLKELSNGLDIPIAKEIENSIYIPSDEFTKV